MLKFLGVSAVALALAACGVNAAGNETVLGISTPISAASVAVAQSDVQAVVAALPQLCSAFEQGASLTLAEIAALKAAKVNVPPNVVAAISKLSTNGQVGCVGTVAVLADVNGNAAATVAAPAN